MSVNYTKISHEFINFKTNLKTEISSDNFTKNATKNECYYIKEKLFNEIGDKITELNNRKNIGLEVKMNLFKLLISKNNQEIINDISSAINNLENNSNLKLISKNIISSCNEKNFVLKLNSVKYYAGNNKLIIEFYKSDLSDILLIINPLENLSKQTIYSFSIKIDKIEKKLDLFKDLIQNEILNQIFRANKIKEQKLNIKRENKEELKTNTSLDSNSLQSSQSFNLIIKFLISIYYYELSLTNKNKEYIINQNQKSYLIDPEFIENIKTFYKYQELENKLNNVNKEFDYSNFTNQVEKIYEECKNNPDIIDIPTSIEVFKTKNILPKGKTLGNFTIIESFYVLPKIIMEIIKTFFSNSNKHSIHSVSHFWKNENLCILKNDQIYISSYDTFEYFKSEYIICYKNFKNLKNLSSDEFKCLLKSSDIKEYLNLRKVKDYSANIQRIYGENGSSIGRLIIPNNCGSINETCPNIDHSINKIKFNKTINNNRSLSIPKNVSGLNPSLKPLINLDNNEEKQDASENEDYKKSNKKDRNNSVKTNKIKKINFLESLIKETPKKENLRENKDNEILIKQNEEFKFIINKKESELNKIKNLYDELQEKLKVEKEKNKELKKNIKNLEQKNKEIEEQNEIKDKEKDKKIENLLSLNKNLEEEKNNLQEKYQKLNKKYEKLNEEYENQKKDIKKKSMDSDNNNNNLKEKENEILLKQKEINETIIFLEKKKTLLYEEEKKIKKNKEQLNKDFSENRALDEKNKELSKLYEILKEENSKMKSELEEMKNKIKKKKEKEKGKNNLNQSAIAPSYEINNLNNIGININNINNININNNEDNNNNRIRRCNSLPNKKQKPIELYLQPTLIGLNNIGATCFMNSTLQCLSQTGDLTNFFLSEKNENYIHNVSEELSSKNELCLSKVYLQLIKKLWNKNEQGLPYSPTKFMKTVNELNPLFKTGEAGDAKDFIIFVLEQLHRELKKPIMNQINVKKEENINQYDRMNSFNNFFEEFKKECSIISDVFFGFNETTNVCLNCKNNYNSKGMVNPVCYNYGIFNCIIIPLEEVKKMKNSYYRTNDNRVNINECLFYNQKSELFTGENQNYCNICRKLYNSVYTSQIYISPNNLIIILNRGKNNIYNVKLDFALRIDITEFVLMKTERSIYDLYGVITHIGQSGPNAHFVATCKSPVDGCWYRYNDAIVNTITDIQKEVIDFGVPYILFYQKPK